MIKQIGIVLGAVICCNTSLYTMYEDKFFAKTAGDVVVPFDKNLLPHMKTLETMHKDFPATEALGSLDNPFPLENVTADDFNNLLNFLRAIDQYVESAIDQYVKAKKREGSAVPESGILVSMTDILGNNKYGKLAKLIRTADYLDLVLLEKLKQYPSFMRESVESALKAGLKELNKLEGSLLLSIKNEFIDTICFQIEQLWELDRNDPKRKEPQLIQKFPANYNIRDTYMKRPHNHINYMLSSTGPFVHWHSNPQTNIFTINRQIYSPTHFQNMSQIPNQHLISEQFAQLNIRPQQLPFPDIMAYTQIMFSPNDKYFCLTFFMPPANQLPPYGATSIRTFDQKEIALPNYTTFFSNFTDAEGKEKLVAILWTTGQKEKIVIIDPETQICTLALENDNPNDHLVSAHIPFGTLLIQSGDRSSKSSIIVFDLDKKNSFFIDSQRKQTYSKLISWVDENKKIKVVALDNSNQTQNHIDTYIIDTTTRDIFFASERTVPYRCTIIYCDEVPSKYIVINLAQERFKNLQHLDIVNSKQSMYIAGYDSDTNTLPIFGIISKQFAKKVMDTFKNSTTLSIEQLYMLERITDRISRGEFKTMTPSEKKLFDKLPLSIQTLLYELVGKKLIEAESSKIEAESSQSVINIKKAAELEAPLPGYVKQQPSSFALRATADKHGQKRPAQGPIEELRPTKKRKTEPVESEEESEAEDETTLDESEEDKE